MAKCILSEDLRNAGIIGISGIVSREKPTKYNPNPVRVLMSMRNGVQHISIGRKPVRSTAPSVEELQRRELFAICSHVTNYMLKNFALNNNPELRKLIFAATRKTFRAMQNNFAKNYTWQEVAEGLLYRTDILEKATPAQVISRLKQYVSKN